MNPGVSETRIGVLPNLSETSSARLRIEEVHPHHALRVPRRGRDAGHRERGGVRGEHRPLPHHTLEVLEDLLLHTHVLDNGLHDKRGP